MLVRHLTGWEEWLALGKEPDKQIDEQVDLVPREGRNRNHLIPDKAVLFGQSSGPVAPLDPQALNRGGSLYLTRPTLGHYVATADELRQRSTELLHRVGDRSKGGHPRRLRGPAHRHPKERAGATRSRVSDREVLENPYRIVEADLGDTKEHAVALGVIDRGLLPDVTVTAAHPIPAPSAVDSPADWRRHRAALVTVLRRAAQDGDALLSDTEALTRLGLLDLARPCVISSDWLAGNRERLAGEVDRVDLLTDPLGGEQTSCLQLTELRDRERRLANILDARAVKLRPVAKRPHHGRQQEHHDQVRDISSGKEPPPACFWDEIGHP